MKGTAGVYLIGIDVGAAFTKAVLMSGGQIKEWIIVPTRGDYRQVAAAALQQLLSKAAISRAEVKYMVATGAGAAAVTDAGETASDISCSGLGINFVFPSVRTVIDIGSQFTRVFRIDNEGKLMSFIMSEKCAAGSGRLLQVMSRILQVDIIELGNVYSFPGKKINFTTGCAVFNESEVVSRIAEGNSKEDIIDGIQASLAAKVESLVERIKLEKDYSVIGGCAKNGGLLLKLAEKLGVEPLVYEEPQIITALGAALMATEKIAQNSK